MILILLFISTTFHYCQSKSVCDISIVESIPENLTYVSTAYIAPPLWKTMVDLIANSHKYIKINSLYWTMLSNDTNITDSSSKIGSKIFSMLIDKSKTIPILINQDSTLKYSNDINILRQHKNINISFINVTRLAGGGVQHSKLMIGDGTRVFIGSANMDWRSFTQIKEIGAYITNCNELISDLDAFWNTVNYLSGSNSRVPKEWPKNLWPKYNSSNPLRTTVNKVPMELYIASSPPLFNPPHRTSDLDAITSTIMNAKKFILISVMNYAPLYTNYSFNSIKYWPEIENAILAVAINKRVSVKILISFWKYTLKDNFEFLRGFVILKLGKIAKIDVKVFIIPAFNEFQKNLPYSRVSHSKYMVTDSTSYIGTSNWSGNYFVGTVGVSLIAKETCKWNCGSNSIRKDMENIFFTDWNSIYAHNLQGDMSYHN